MAIVSKAPFPRVISSVSLITGIGCWQSARWPTRNLDTLGHLVVKFTGATVAQLSGDVCVEAAPLPVLRSGCPFVSKRETVTRKLTEGRPGRND